MGPPSYTSLASRKRPSSKQPASRRRTLCWLLPSIGLVITTSFAVSLLVLNVKEWRSSEHFADFVLDHRSTIAIAVQILSTVLGLIQVHVLSFVTTSSLRVSLPRRASSLDTIRLISSTATPSIAWNARWYYWLASVLFMGFSFLPGAFWAGAITPTNEETEVNVSLNIPTFHEANLSTMWNAGVTDARRVPGYGNSYLWMTPMGLFTFELYIASLRGAFLEIASTASNTSTINSPRRKVDETGYRYTNRSYGLGAGVGLIDVPDTKHPRWFRYHEEGFQSHVNCARNETSAFEIQYTVNNDAESFHAFFANGSFANGANYTTPYPQQAPQRQDIFAWAIAYDTARRKTYISLAVDGNATHDDWDFKQFDKVQCEVDYRATDFVVMVNNTAKTISTSADAEIAWPEYADTVLTRLNEFYRYSAEEGMLFGSQLGHSIVMNINQLRLMPGSDNDNATFRGLEDHITSLFDNGLGSLSAARLVGASKTLQVHATVGLQAMTYGDRTYVVATLVINTLILIVFLSTAIWTGLWGGMTNMEFDDIGSVMLCASQGGDELAREATRFPDKHIGKMQLRIRSILPDQKEAIVLE